jgi:multidrug efflux pump subunit AcrA (membrane-fusion protein)
MSKLGKSVKWCSFVGVIGGLSFGGWRFGPGWYAKYQNWSRDPVAVAKQEAAKFVAVRKADLRITVTEDGKLKAIKYHPVFPQLKGSANITFIVPEGTHVKKGDKVVEFDKKALQDALQTKTGELEAARREVVMKEEALKIQRATSKAAVKAALTKKDEADVALKVYRDLEGPKKLQEMESQKNDYLTKHQTAQKTLDEFKKQLEDQLFNEESQRKRIEAQVADAKETVDSYKKAIDQIEVSKKVFKRYDYPQNIKTKMQAIENADLEVEKAKVAANSEVLAKEAEFNKFKDTITRLTRDIADLSQQIEKMELKAPADGMVLYGDPNNERSYYYDMDSRIRVGASWYGQNTIVTIPDLSAFEVTLTIGEEYRGRLQEGVASTLTMEAIPGLLIGGKLTEISKLARNRHPWDQSSPKVFDGKVLPDKNDPRMIPGMSVRVEMLAETIREALVVPVEGIFNEDGKTVCYVKRHTPEGGVERREVEVGKSNEHMAQVLKGLREGEMVDVSPQRMSGGGGAAAEKKDQKKEEAKPATPLAAK